MLTYNISYQSYLKSISSIEDKFNYIKQIMIDNNIPLSHPSTAIQLNNLQIHKLSELFPLQIEKFQNAFNFYKALEVINYHLCSLLLMTETLEFKDIVSVSISIEDYLTIVSFNS